MGIQSDGARIIIAFNCLKEYSNINGSAFLGMCLHNPRSSDILHKRTKFSKE